MQNEWCRRQSCEGNTAITPASTYSILPTAVALPAVKRAREEGRPCSCVFGQPVALLLNAASIIIIMIIIITLYLFVLLSSKDNIVKHHHCREGIYRETSDHLSPQSQVRSWCGGATFWLCFGLDNIEAWKVVFSYWLLWECFFQHSYFSQCIIPCKYK